MDWKAFEEGDYWQAILGLLKDREELIRRDLEDENATDTVLAVRMLQQELKDLAFFSQLPEIFRKHPEKRRPAEVEEDGDGVDESSE